MLTIHEVAQDCRCHFDKATSKQPRKVTRFCLRCKLLQQEEFRYLKESNKHKGVGEEIRDMGSTLGKRIKLDSGDFVGRRGTGQPKHHLLLALLISIITALEHC